MSERYEGPCSIGLCNAQSLIRCVGNILGDEPDAAMECPAFAYVTYLPVHVTRSDEIVPNVFDTGAPREAWLHYHHEMAYVNQSTSMLGFCARAACDTPGKGAMFLSDNIRATDSLMATEFGAKLAEKGICYIRCLTDREEDPGGPVNSVGESAGVYNHWQQSFSATTREEVESQADAKGLELEWGPGNFLRTKHYTSAFEYFPPLDRNLLYASVADHDMWWVLVTVAAFLFFLWQS